MIKRNKTKSKSKKVAKRNPISSRKMDTVDYIDLSSFVKEFNKQLKKNTSYDFYHDLGYEIDNILKYSLRNSNLVSGGKLNLMPLNSFKKTLSRGIEHRFLESGYYSDILTGFELALAEIPKTVTFVDTGN